MNTNPLAKRILCYGDSNTYGSIPGKHGQRYPADVRWTGLLQRQLGNSYEIIEEGLGGRTTTIDDPNRHGRNGKDYLEPCLQTHNPLDVIILMLGTNDLKEKFNRNAEQIAEGIKELLEIIKANTVETAKIVLISPAYVDDTTPEATTNYHGATEKSKQLASYYEQVALQYKCEFIDSAKIVQSSPIDGYHLEPTAHQKLAEIVTERIKKDLWIKLKNY